MNRGRTRLHSSRSSCANVSDSDSVKQGRPAMRRRLASDHVLASPLSSCGRTARTLSMYQDVPSMTVRSSRSLDAHGMSAVLDTLFCAPLTPHALQSVRNDVRIYYYPQRPRRSPQGLSTRA